MKKLLALFLFFLIPFAGFSHWGDFIDTTIVSEDSLIRIVNHGESEGSAWQGNSLLEIYYRNKLAIKLKNPKQECIADSSYDYGISHLAMLPLIAECEKIDSNHYVLLGYNLSDKKTGKFIWILEVNKGRLAIKTRISMLSYRSPDAIEFFINKGEGFLYFYSSANRVIGDHIYIIAASCEDSYKLSPVLSDERVVRYSFSGIPNPPGAPATPVSAENNPLRVYRVKFK